LFSLAVEWSDISKSRSAALFGLLAVLFYLLYIVFIASDTHFPDREIDRKTRFLQKKRACKNAHTGLFFAFLFVVTWGPRSAVFPLSAVLGVVLLLVGLLIYSFLNHHRRSRRNKKTAGMHPDLTASANQPVQK